MFESSPSAKDDFADGAAIAVVLRPLKSSVGSRNESNDSQGFGETFRGHGGSTPPDVSQRRAGGNTSPGPSPKLGPRTGSPKTSPVNSPAKSPKVRLPAAESSIRESFNSFNSYDSGDYANDFSDNFDDHDQFSDSEGGVIVDRTETGSPDSLVDKYGVDSPQPSPSQSSHSKSGHMEDSQVRASLYGLEGISYTV